MGKIISIKNSKGNYNGFDYSNFLITTVEGNYTNQVSYGLILETKKIKSSDLIKYCEQFNLTLSSLLEKDLNVSYNKYGKIKDFSIK